MREGKRAGGRVRERRERIKRGNILPGEVVHFYEPGSELAVHHDVEPEDFETAFREKFQRASDQPENGLSPQEMALEPGASMSSVFLRGSLTNVFDLTSLASLAPIAKVFGKISMPSKAVKLKKKLKTQKNYYT